MMLRNGFGDCKDKASALAAMCAYAGIRAERVLVNRGGVADPNFPFLHFGCGLECVIENSGACCLNLNESVFRFFNFPDKTADF